MVHSTRRVAPQRYPAWLHLQYSQFFSNHSIYTVHFSYPNNPHGVTYAQIGADPSGSAAAVQSNLNTHTADQDNPHNVTCIQIGADPLGSAFTVQSNLNTHTANKQNPHNVTCAQVGADPSGSASTVQSNLNVHTANKQNPHGVTCGQIGAVPTKTTINGRPLTGDVTLTPQDIGAFPAESGDGDYARSTIFRLGTKVTFGKHYSTGAPLKWTIVDYAYGKYLTLWLHDGIGNMMFTREGAGSYWDNSIIRSRLNSADAGSSSPFPDVAKSNGFLYNFTAVERNNIFDTYMFTRRSATSTSLQ